MNIKIISPHLPGGWDYYCCGCDMFFSAYSAGALIAKYCPVCGWDALIKDPEEFKKAYPHYDYAARRAS